MSSSVFKVYSSSSRDGFENDAGSSGAKEADLNDAAAVHEDLKIDSNLVILVNKDGTVSVDQNTLQSLLANETTDTSVSVVRITSPTPSIENEIEEEQRRWKEAKQQMDADVGDAGSSNEDSSEESNSVAGTSSGASSVTGVATRRGRAPTRKGAGPPMEDSDDPRHVSLTVEAYYPPEEASSFAAQVLSLTGYQHPLRKETVDIDYLKHTVMNDHCYTPLTSPTQKLPPRAPFDGSEIDSAEESASATSSRPKVITLSHPSSKIIDRRKTLGVKLNKTLPTSMARSVTGDVEKGRKSVAGPAPTPRQEPPRQRANRATHITASPDPLDLDDVEDEDDDEVDFDYSEEEETSFSEEDDDEMDADFRVSGTPSARRRKQPTKSKVSPKTPSRSQFRKLDMKELTEREAMKEAGKHKVVKVVGSKPSAPGGKLSWQQQAAGKIAGQTGPKLVKRDVSNLRSNIGPTPTSAGLSTPTASNNKLHGSLPIVSKAHSKPESVQTKATPTTSSISSTPTTPTTNVVAPVIKKEKKPKSNAHDTALLNDMSALFSTPDIIKKVNSSKATTLTTPTTPTTPNVGPSAIPVGVTLVTGAPPPAIVKQASVNTSVAVVEEKPSPLPSPPSPPPAPVPVSLAPVPIAQSSPAAEQRLDLINAIVQEELHQPNVTLPAGEPAISSSQLSSQPMEIPNIVQMLETSVSAVDGTGSLMNAMLPEIKPMEHVHTAPPPVDLLPDTSILEALNSNEDALPEDLLEHVAELAKNKELQEILDKQVLGVIGTGPLLGQSAMPMTSMLTNLMPEQQPQVMQQPTTSVATFPMQNVPVYTEPAGKPEPPVVPNPATDAPPPAAKEQSIARKEAILVRRSDGRVITLPPIEAPATRASKRRAQGGTPTARASAGQSPAVPSGVEPVAGALPVEVAPPPQAPKPTRLSKGSVQTPSSSRPATPGHPVDESGPSELVIDEAKGKRANSKVRQSVDSRAKRASTTSVAIAVEAAQDDDLESDESWNSEDDPDRLWCICRQPHNNRFMICCDSCEDWFHGKCVNITKAMGQQMEQDGIEWTCPNCLKKKQDRQQPKMTEFLVATSAEGSKTGKAPTIAKPAPGTRTITASVPSEKETNCIVCSKPAKPSSIYCSDDCIRKHASNTVASASQVLPTAKVDKPKERPPASSSVSSPVVLKDNNVVILMERKTGRCITGKNAPSLENLKAWLEAHPTFELVPPGSVQASIIIAKQAEVRKAQLANEAAEKKAAAGAGPPGQTPASSTSAANTSGSQSPKVQTQLKLNEQKKLVISSHAASPTLSASKTSGTSPKHATPKVFSPAASALGVKGTATPSTATSKVVSSSPSLQKGVAGTSNATVPSPATPANTSASSKQKKQTTPSSSASTEPARQSQGTKTATTPGGENIRVTVKKTLKEHLMQRTSELKEDIPITRLTEEEIDQFVSNTERELFYLFNKDTGMKYRAKYRSLVFNIKDRKNLSLFQKISEKSIEPKQLVRMTAEELASQELAQWRENETKHQLEMIKKSELDLLACAKNYVLKTHKGEEVIEGKTDDRVQLDPSAPVEDVVSLLNNSAVSSTSELDDSSSGMKDSLYRSKDYDYGGYGKLYSGVYGSGSISSSSSNIPAASGGSKSEGHVSGAGASSSSSSRKKESRRSSRSRSRSRGRKHERDRSRDRSRSKHKRKRSRDRSHDRHPSRDRDRERERDRERDRERERERDRDRHHRGRERSKERSKHDRKGSREKDGSKASSEKHRSSIGTTRGTDGADPVAKTTAETERKEDKNEAQSKLVGTLKKRTADATGKVIAEEPKTSPVVAADGKMTEAKTVVKETQDKERNISETAMAKDSDVKSIKSIDTATMPPATSSAEGKESSQESKADQDQEPTSTVTIPTPPHYPYEEEPLSEGTVPVVDERLLEAEKEHWKGSVHMVDVASVEMSIRSVSGEVHDVTKDFTEDLNICGTIKPEIVWEYIGQIKKSPNKEVCLVRFHSTESSAYYTLYNHLHSRKRYSVVKTPSPAIKDFYIFPLPAEQMIPMILKPVRGIGIVEGDRKPNLLLGILVKIRGGKRGPPSNATSAQPQLKVARRQSKHSMSTMGSKVSGSTSASSTDSLLQQVITKYATKSSGVSPSGSAVKEGSSELADAQHSEKVKDVVAMEPGAEKGTRKSQAKDTMDMDLDMNIIKAPIAGKASNMSSTLAMSGDGNSNSSSTSATARASMVESSAMLIDEDDDAPYSPGGGSDDSNFADVTAIVDTSKMQARGTARADPTLASESDQIQLAMDELNRKIAEQKNEIVGLMSMADLKEDEINSTIPPSLIQDIPIPSNLSEILASIKGGSSGGSGVISGAIGSESLAAPSVPGMGMIITEASSAVVNDADTDANLDDEYNPTAPSIFASYKAASIPYPAIPVANSQGDIDERILPATMLPAAPAPTVVASFDMASAIATQTLVTGLSGTLAANVNSVAPPAGASGESRLAKLSEEELLSMVPDDAILPDSSSKDP